MKEKAGNSKGKPNNKSSIKKDINTTAKAEMVSNRKKRRRKKETKAFALLFLVIACLGALVLPRLRLRRGRWG